MKYADRLVVVVSDVEQNLYLFEYDHVINAFVEDLVNRLDADSLLTVDPEDVEVDWEPRFEKGYQADVYIYDKSGKRFDCVDTVDAVRYVAEQAWETTVETYGELLDEEEDGCYQ